MGPFGRNRRGSSCGGERWIRHPWWSSFSSLVWRGAFRASLEVATKGFFRKRACRLWKVQQTLGKGTRIKRGGGGKRRCTTPRRRVSSSSSFFLVKVLFLLLHRLLHLPPHRRIHRDNIPHRNGFVFHTRRAAKKRHRDGGIFVLHTGDLRYAVMVPRLPGCGTQGRRGGGWWGGRVKTTTGTMRRRRRSRRRNETLRGEYHTTEPKSIGMSQGSLLPCQDQVIHPRKDTGGGSSVGGSRRRCRGGQSG